jgi:hypothetical protein
LIQIEVRISSELGRITDQIERASLTRDHNAVARYFKQDRILIKTTCFATLARHYASSATRRNNERSS